MTVSMPISPRATTRAASVQSLEHNSTMPSRCSFSSQSITTLGWAPNAWKTKPSTARVPGSHPSGLIIQLSTKIPRGKFVGLTLLTSNFWRRDSNLTAWWHFILKKNWVVSWWLIVAFWFFCKCWIVFTWCLHFEWWVQACSECIVASYPERQGCSMYGGGAVMHDEMSIKAGAHWLTRVALLSVAREHSLVLPGGAKPLVQSGTPPVAMEHCSVLPKVAMWASGSEWVSECQSKAMCTWANEWIL